MQVAEHTARGDADIGIATEALASFPDLVTMPCYQWNRCVLVPTGHPLAKVKVLTLAALARYPIVTYDFTFTGRSQINAAFDAEGLAPNVVLTALDSDVIKTYVELGLGVGIIAEMAYDPDRDQRVRRSSTRDTCSRRRRRGSPFAAARSCVATSTISSTSSRPRSIARRSTPRCPARNPRAPEPRDRTP